MKSRTYKSLGEFFGLSAMIGANAPKRQLPKMRRARHQTQADYDALMAAQAKRERKTAKLEGNGK